MRDNFDIISKDCSASYSNADGKFLLWVEKTFGIGTGRRKACSDAGLSGAQKRACARVLRKSGWVKGQPIPENMAGITPTDVAEAEKYPPLPTEIYESPYQVTPYTAVTKETENGIETYYPEQPAGEVKGGKKSIWDSMSATGQVVTVVGVSGVIFFTIYGVRQAIKNSRKASPVLSTPVLATA